MKRTVKIKKRKMWLGVLYKVMVFFMFLLALSQTLMSYCQGTDSVIRPKASSRKPYFKPHLFHLDGRPWSSNENLGADLDGILDNDSSTFIFHGLSGSGKSSLIESLCMIDEGTLSDGATQKTTLHKQIFNAKQTKSVTIIDTPGFGNRFENADIVLEGMEDAIAMVKSSDSPLRQIYVVIRSRTNGLKKYLDAIISFYGEASKGYITLVVNHSDSLTDDVSNHKRLKEMLIRDAEEILERKPFVLFVSSTEGLVQLSEHMVQSRDMPGLEVHEPWSFRSVRTEVENRIKVLEQCLSIGQSREESLRSDGDKNMWFNIVWSTVSTAAGLKATFLAPCAVTQLISKGGYGIKAVKGFQFAMNCIKSDPGIVQKIETCDTLQEMYSIANECKSEHGILVTKLDGIRKLVL